VYTIERGRVTRSGVAGCGQNISSMLSAKSGVKEIGKEKDVAEKSVGERATVTRL
jgi:hypothetical protein